MNEAFYKMYKSSKQMLESIEDKGHSEEFQDLCAGLRAGNRGLEMSRPEYLQRYEREKRMQDSLTQEQIDFICYQIGDWYLEWQEKMWVDGKPNQHWLGMAKEQLKTMICGE